MQPRKVWDARIQDIYKASFELTCLCARVLLHLLWCSLLSLLTCIVIVQELDILLVGVEHAILEASCYCLHLKQASL